MTRGVLAAFVCGGLVVSGVWPLHPNGRMDAGGATAVDAPLDPPRFHHLHLNVVEPDASRAFYTKYFPASAARDTVFGFPAVKVGPVWMLFSKVSKKAPDQDPENAFWHFGWQVDNSVEFTRRASALGAPFHPYYTDDGRVVTHSNEWWPGLLTKAQVPAAAARGVKPTTGGVSFMRGPSGERIELQGDLPVERFNHVHMYQDDAMCAELWYRAHLNAPPTAMFGKRRVPQDPSDCGLPFAEPSWLSLVPQGTIRDPRGGVLLGDVDLLLYPRQRREPLASTKGHLMDHVGLGVKDLDAWHTKLRHEQVKVVRGPYTLGTTRAFMVEGPSREQIEIVEVK